MVMEEVRGKNRRKHNHTERLTEHELAQPLSEFLHKAGLPTDEPLDLTIDDDGVTIAPAVDRLDGVAGTMPGLTELMDVENEREAWDR